MTPSRTVRALALVAVLVAASAAPLAGAAAGASDHAEFERVVAHGPQNGTIGIPISVPTDADGVQVTVGTENANFTAHAVVADADGNGTVVLRVDTATAGNGNASSYFSTSEGDALRSATQETPTIEPPLEPADYVMSLGPPDDPVDKATLIVEAPSDDRPNYLNRTTTAGTRTTTPGANGTTLVYEGERLSLSAGTGQTVRGETALEPGTELTVRLRSTGEHPFLERKPATVSQYGTFEATFDLTGVPAGTTFEVSVRGDGSQLVSRPGRVADCAGGCPTTTERDRAATADLPADEIAVASHVEVTQTHAVEIPVTLGDADAVTVVVGGEEVNYRVQGVVRDYDGDARTIVRFNTRAAGFDERELGLYDAGRWQSIENYSETPLPSLLAAGEYPVRVYRGTNTTDDPAAEGTLVIYEAPSAVGSPTTTSATPTTASTRADGTTDAPDGSLLAGSTLWGVGAILAGGVLAVVGVGVVLGVFRR